MCPYPTSSKIMITFSVFLWNLYALGNFPTNYCPLNRYSDSCPGQNTYLERPAGLYNSVCVCVCKDCFSITRPLGTLKPVLKTS